MEYSLVKKLQPLVTTFSEAIRLKYKHEDEVCIGGKITKIFNFPKIINDEGIVEITVDDNVGVTILFVPSVIYKNLEQKREFEIGDIILATGKVYDPYNTLDKDRVASIVCWNIELLES